ncbi:polymer-forming cytoskeletal protein [Bartonella rattimassiliensis]|uniref:Phage related protein n=2 Tax=Bartonella rattimassiliensis 15908 TaxID=1094556 RepID=J0QMU2_9HYPH|nr:polymer-forming cytoskeletal protein [Bartonella rattimassiliensis]EJF86996.1 hypothetical protein MCY_00526 [Bartonella rattimassiliensis 15908]
MTSKNVSKKYEITNETTEVKGHLYGKVITLYRIKALRSFGGVKKGDLGGFIESEYNLSHDGSCWVGDDAKVYNAAMVWGHAKVFENAIICDEACVNGFAKVYGNVHAYGKAIIGGRARVFGDTQLISGAWVIGRKEISTGLISFGNR